MLRPSSSLQAFFQVLKCLAIPVANVPYHNGCHVASLSWMQEVEENIYSAGLQSGKSPHQQGARVGNGEQSMEGTGGYSA